MHIHTSRSPFKTGVFALTTAQIRACIDAATEHSISEETAAKLPEEARHIVAHVGPAETPIWNVLIILVVDYEREEDGTKITGSELLSATLKLPTSELNLVYRGTLYEPKETKVLGT